MNTKPLRQKKDLHLSRKFWHAGGILTMMILYHNVSDKAALAIVCGISLAFIPLDIARHYYPKLNRFIISLFGRVMRKDEAIASVAPPI